MFRVGVGTAIAIQLFGCAAAAEQVTLISASSATAEGAGLEETPPPLPDLGCTSLSVIADDLIAVHVTTREDVPWTILDPDGQLRLPSAAAIEVSENGVPVAITALGFRRRPVYAGSWPPDLRVDNYLYMRLQRPLASGAHVTLRWPALIPQTLHATVDPLRESAAIHVNQVGYAPALPKRAVVAMYLGTLGELSLAARTPFHLVDVERGEVVFSGLLQPHRDVGFAAPAPYQEALLADFSAFHGQGRFRLEVPGLGTSPPFVVDDRVMLWLMRAYARGLYRQRCGLATGSPQTRFAHAPCHLQRAFVPDSSNAYVERALHDMSASSAGLHDATRLDALEHAFNAFVRRGAVDVHGGHHDAGDYGKYTTNSALLVHHLIFAADTFAGVADLDDLGLPESGDGKSDFVQLAKWEADFLVRMQDSDGGFYYMVRPRDQAYEPKLMPDHGLPQVVYPKTTTSTAAAVGALSQLARSPSLRRLFPDDARRYRSAAELGWAFLQRAWQAHGRAGAYQKLNGAWEPFGDVDWVAWAAVETWIASGSADAAVVTRELLTPSRPTVRRWTWWRLQGGFGPAIRSCATATTNFDAALRQACATELAAAAGDAIARSDANAFLTSFPVENKRFNQAGWYFSSERGFDVLAANRLYSTPRLDVVVSNLDYELGSNGTNTSFVTGVGSRRLRVVVDQQAAAMGLTAVPSGVIVGSVRSSEHVPGFASDLAALYFPKPAPLYERATDSWNVTAESTSMVRAASLAVAAGLWAHVRGAGGHGRRAKRP